MSATGRSCTQIFLKVQYIISQAILSRKLMKKFTVTNEKIFRVYEVFGSKILTVIRIWGLPTHSFWNKAVNMERKTTQINFCH